MSWNIDGKTERKRRTIFRDVQQEAKSPDYAKSPEWIKLRRALLDVLEQHPEARMAVIRAMEENRGWASGETDGGRP